MPVTKVPETPKFPKIPTSMTESAVVVDRPIKVEVVQSAKTRLSGFIDAGVARIRQKYASARADLDKREAREVAQFVESMCERAKTAEDDAPPPRASWFF